MSPSSLWDCWRASHVCVVVIPHRWTGAGSAEPHHRAYYLQPLIMCLSLSDCRFVCVSMSLAVSLLSAPSRHRHHLCAPAAAPWFTPGCEGSQLGRGGAGGGKEREGEERRDEEEEDRSEVPTVFPCRHSRDQNGAQNINSGRNLLFIALDFQICTIRAPTYKTVCTTLNLSLQKKKQLTNSDAKH